MSLPAHGHGFEGDDVEDGAECGKEHIERRPQVGFLYFGRGEVCDVEADEIFKLTRIPTK